MKIPSATLCTPAIAEQKLRTVSDGHFMDMRHQTSNTSEFETVRHTRFRSWRNNFLKEPPTTKPDSPSLAHSHLHNLVTRATGSRFGRALVPDVASIVIAALLCMLLICFGRCGGGGDGDQQRIIHTLADGAISHATRHVCVCTLNTCCRAPAALTLPVSMKSDDHTHTLNKLYSFITGQRWANIAR